MELYKIVKMVSRTGSTAVVGTALPTLYSWHLTLDSKTIFQRRSKEIALILGEM